MKSVNKKLASVQSRLKAPKSQTNKFANYKYRSLEDIVEAVKPLLAEEGLTLIMSDTPIIVGDRYYIESTATLTCVDTGEQIVTKAVAREPLQKKGSDESQITGASSSYSRKYNLNGLLAIDDTKDADATNDHQDRATFKFKRGEKEEVMQKVLEALSVGDDVAIKSVLHEYDSPESKMAVWGLFNSTERATIKKLLEK